jgi:hypothetical protein
MSILKEGGSFETFNDVMGNPLISINRDGTINTLGVGFANGTKQTTAAGPGGTNTQIQFNDSGSFAGANSFTWDKVNSRFNVGLSTSSLVLTPDILQNIPLNQSWNTIVNKTTGTTTYPRQTLMVYQETNASGGSGVDYIGVGSVINIIPDSNSPASIRRVTSFYAAPSVGGAGTTINNLNPFKNQIEISGGGNVGNVVEFLSYLPVITDGSVVTNWTGYFQDLQASYNTGNITNHIGARLGRQSNNGVTITNSYGIALNASTAGLIVQAYTGWASGSYSFIGHGDTTGSMPFTLYDGWYSGTTTPQGNMAANVGSIASRQDGVPGAVFYVKESGTGNTVWQPVITASGPPQFTVANLPAGTEGAIAYATNGRKVGQGAGSGTGVPVYFSSTLWRVYSTDAQVTA